MMIKYTKMEVVMVAGIILSLFMPSSAQEGLPGDCWQRIANCTSSASPGEIQQQCCPVITQEINNEKECFCGVNVLVLQNDTIAETLSDLLTLCSFTSSFDTLCPVKFQEAPCWKQINQCIGGNVNRSESEPQFDPSSPLFNATELLCCSTMQQTARIEKQCFCSINTFIQENPSFAENTTDILSVCSIAGSVDSLSDLCEESLAPSSAPAPAPAPAPLVTTQGSIESLKAASPVTERSNSSGTANKIGISGSICCFFLLTYILYQ